MFVKLVKLEKTKSKFIWLLHETSKFKTCYSCNIHRGGHKGGGKTFADAGGRLEISDLLFLRAGAYEGFCFLGGTICARKRAKKNLVPPLGNIVPPLKTPFLKKYWYLFKKSFASPLPPGLVLFTIKIHQKDYIFGWLLTLLNLKIIPLLENLTF